ncbi:MAG: histidine kinase, partial [Rhodothermaceae bacterium]|nr:histidine kinase [Rhodothermaceae bacterium]
DGQVEIRVEDNGSGMPEEVAAKVFEPFFTTKPTGEGTGLGLSMSYDIVTQGHGGALAVESEEGRGAAFTLLLPAS